MKMNGVHKSNNYTPKGLFFELVSLGGKEIEKTFDISECVVFDKNIETSKYVKYFQPEKTYYGSIVTESQYPNIDEDLYGDIRIIEDIDYVKDNAICHSIMMSPRNFGIELDENFIISIITGYISDNGSWVGNVLPSAFESDVASAHKIDLGIQASLEQLFEDDSSVVDFGCGNADYSRYLVEKGLDCEAYDGNPNTPEMTNGFGRVLDLTKPFDLGKKFDYVVCLEVAEHIPLEYQDIFVENLVKHTDFYLVISWAVEGQGGDGHINEQNEDYVLNLFKNKNMNYNKEVSDFIKHNATLGWFKETVYVFRREE